MDVRAMSLPFPFGATVKKTQEKIVIASVDFNDNTIMAIGSKIYNQTDCEKFTFESKLIEGQS